ncbi:MAG: DUF6266 family protein [Bacteroidales bacterium]|jgi:hypothetical protein|nr:DUF6266 family protein [Bacteroidales bacterium]
MASTKEGPLGNYSGRIGNIVAYEMFGKTIMRSRPSGKRRPAQGALKQAQTDFSKVMKVMQSARSAVRVGFNPQAEGRSAFHAAMSVNLVNYRNAASPEDLHWLVISQGERSWAQDVAMTIEGNKAVVTWGDPEPGKRYSVSDQVMLLAMNDTSLDSSVNLQAAQRKEKRAELALPPAKAGENILVFMAFHNPIEASSNKSLENVSDSRLIG